MTIQRASLVCSWLLVLLAQRASAQTSPTRAMADGIHADRNVYIMVRPSANELEFRYREDAQATLSKAFPLKGATLFTVDRSRGLNILLDFLNPIRYRWSITEASVAEPTFSAAKSFFESVTGLLKIVAPETTGESQASQQVAENTKARVSAANEARKDSSETRPQSGQASTPILYAPDLVDWSIWTWQPEIVKCVSNSAGPRPAWIRLKTAVEAADKEFFESTSEESQRNSSVFSKRLGAIANMLIQPDAMALMKQNAAMVRDSAETLQRVNVNASKTLKTVKDAVGTEWISKGNCTDFQRYTQGVIARFLATSEVRLGARQAVVSNLVSLNDALRTLLAQTDEDAFFVGTVSVPDGLMKDVTLSVVPKERTSSDNPFAFEDKRAASTSFRLRRRQMLLAEFGIGMAVTSIEYPTFGTGLTDGKLVVQSVEPKTQNFSGVAMLNLVYAKSPLGFVLPMVQLGAGTARAYPLFLVGGGFRFLTEPEFAVSVGAVFPWKQKLDGLKPGDPVTGTADVERATTYRLTSPGWYISLQKVL